ncbi:MAG: ABC transporter permease [Henriciella sp.]|uniref:ABC transporter permease n=1 Tax=Henriciella sp. TaxID=1968823 RepID=UPI003C7608B9
MSGPKSVLSALQRHGALWPLVALGLIWLIILIVNPGFFAFTVHDGRVFGGLIDIFNRGAPVALIAIGMSLVIATGGIDLSVGAVMAIAGAVAANLIVGTALPVPLIILAGLGAGLAAGLLNGTLVAGLGIQPIVATLILLVAGRGVAQLLNDGQIITFQNEAFAFVGVGTLLGLPMPVWLVLIVLAAILALTRATALGLFIEAVGANASASRYAGIPVRAIKLAVYAIAGICAALAGLVATADIQGADANNVGLWIELDAILAVVIGGTSLMGGRYSLVLAVVGALIIQSLNTAIVLSGIPPKFNLVIKAAVIIAVLLLQSSIAQAQFRSLRARVRA